MIMDKSDSIKRLEACFPSDGLVEIRDVREKEKYLKVMMRIRLAQVGDEWAEDAKWDALATRILRIIYAAPDASCFLGKSYFLRGQDKVYGWVLCFYAANNHEDFLLPLESNFGVSKRRAPQGAQQIGAPVVVPKAPAMGIAKGPDRIQSLRKPLDRDLPPIRVHGAASQPFNPNTGKGASPIDSNSRRQRSSRR